MSKYTPTIGLEVHAELKTQSKMFCDCKNDPDVHDEQRRGGTEASRPNVNVCPVCLGHPGTLPVPNKGAIRHILKIGLAVGGTLAEKSKFDRKNYFYPDLPKGYQISQYDMPFVKGGELLGVKITRVHLEEDAGSLLHESRIKNQESSSSLVDFNRAGVPLMELVTEPVMHDAETAVRFAKELQLLLRYLGASDANMEKGEMRVEANISISHQLVRPKSDAGGSSVISHQLGTKVEVKNLNSFKSVGDAIQFEIKRHAEVLARGEKVIQETRGWDENAGKTFSQRKKESANDYRYFPEPDLPKMRISEIPEFQNLNETMPELPWERRLRLSKEFGFQDAITEMFVTDDAIGGFFSDVALKLSGDKDLIKLASNYITSDLAALMKANNGSMGAVTPETFTVLVRMVGAGDVSSRGAKDTLAIMYREGGRS